MDIGTLSDIRFEENLCIQLHLIKILRFLGHVIDFIGVKLDGQAKL